MKIMLLDDEPLIAMATEQMLLDLGHEDVDVFYRLEPAQHAVESTRYDAAILDVNVNNGQTSLDLAQTLKKSGTPVIFASGNSIERPSLDTISVAFIEKPYTLSDVENALSAIHG